ncbi:unnamed protein product [Chilo suppressalis]|uniref:GH16 domain-containing protein n=1 Tax=Chilo suppressalis TaxID=168631 RepID=A0ABN8AST9_CHISP|nr:unnamed protein product [Chilo suppressalis]
MAGDAKSRVWCYIVLLTLSFELANAQNSFKIPDVTIEVLQPKGFRVSMPGPPEKYQAVFFGLVNRFIDHNSIHNIKGEEFQWTNGRWVYEDTNTQLKVGDFITYYVFVSKNGTNYTTRILHYTVTTLGNRSEGSTTQKPNCVPTITSVRGGTACAGQVIFEDDFSALKDAWQIEQYLPVSWHPEYPFVSYQRLLTNPVVSVSNGYLRITPKIQQQMPGFNNESIYLGNLDLFSGCTSRAEECYRQASGPDILPPVVSGRVTTTGFAFKYGTVHVKAKLPLGDWLYPEILLEPFLKKYGSSNYASGVIKIAAARGNRDLRVGSDEYGNKVLYGGPIMDVQCRMQLLSRKLRDNGLWGDEFHEYSLTWTPQYMSLSVDGEEWARVDATGGLASRFPQNCAHLPRMLLEKGTKIAPFDDYFYITLGVAAGGITEFHDNSFSTGGWPKPWRNSGRKAMLSFWEDLPAWQWTWIEPELLIDYIKVIALCTSRGEECYRKASGADILPPILSGRITSSKFAFTYGKIHIRAKLPQGDWLYPELLLEPFLKKYGSFDYASGVLKIASALGNKELKSGSNIYGNESLFAFHGKLNEEMNGLGAGQWSKDITRAKGDRWTFLDRNAVLKLGDKIYF